MAGKRSNIEHIKIFDTTLRDGEQSPGNTMNIQEKLRVARQLETLGVDIIEAGFPVASPGDFSAVREIARTIKKSEVAGLARANDRDIDVPGMPSRGQNIRASTPLSQPLTSISSISSEKPVMRC